MGLRFFLLSYPILLVTGISWATWVTVNLLELRQWRTIGLQTIESAKVQKLEISAERDLAIAALHTQLDAAIDAARKSNLDLQSKMQDQQFEIQRLQDRATKRP